MAIDLDNAVVYDVETLTNAFTLNVIRLADDSLDLTFEISDFRDDGDLLAQWFDYWEANQTPMVGFNCVGFDYPVLHRIYTDPGISPKEIYDAAQAIIASSNYGFGSIIWQSDRFAPQIDLYKIHHFDNRAKSTSLKALEFAMRSELVLDMPVDHATPVTAEQIRTLVIPYNKHDVRETRQFARFSLDAIRFRASLAETLPGDVLNFNDSKLGSKILEHRLGDDVCYTREFDRRVPRQTPRDTVQLADVIFPYIRFHQCEFQRILEWMRTQTLTADEITERLRTKGVFTGVKASINGFDFHFGTGGLHGSVAAQRFASDDTWVIRDIDVAAYYPNIPIQNGLYPAHLGERFVAEYAKLPAERNLHKKGTVQNAALKLAANGTYGNSNNQHSVFYDPQFTMAITINGQLMLCMLAEWLLNVPHLSLIAANTDGLTYRCPRVCVDAAKGVQRVWEAFTQFVLEEVEYSRMWIRDCNSYIAEDTKGKLKLKGAYWYPVNFPADISNSSPPAWHKDFSAQVVIKAAVAAMVEGADIERFVCAHQDKFDFFLRAKCDRSSKLYIGDTEVQRILRYYVAHRGGSLRKVSPPTTGKSVGEYKRKNGVSEYEYQTILATLPPDTWDQRIHTKNRSRYTIRETGINTGWLVAECNRASDFDFSNVNFQWYIEEAKKLVI